MDQTLFDDDCSGFYVIQPGKDNDFPKTKAQPTSNPNKKGLPKSGKPLIVVTSFPENFYIHAYYFTFMHINSSVSAGALIFSLGQIQMQTITG